MKPHRKIGRLIVKYNKQTLTEEEGRKLNEWLQQSEANRILFKHLTNKEYAAKLWAINTEEVRRKIARQPEKAIIRTMKTRSGVVIAAIILLILSAVYFIRYNKKEPAFAGSTLSNHVSAVNFPFKDSLDMAPGGFKALLKLANGDSLDLGQMPVGAETTIGNNKFRKDSGLVTVTCISKDTAAQASSFDTIFVPKGGQFKIKLSDGSVVSLNAASSLTFPTIFAKAERKVELNGEAYFKVNEMTSAEKQYEKIPFIVNAGKTEVHVTGTQFNINAYKDENVAKTTLVNGFIIVNKKVMLPNQTAIVDEKGKTDILNEVDVNEAIAWKTNQFFCMNTPFKQVMRQLERWYNMDVVYKSNIDKCFNLDMPRDAPLSEILEILQHTEEVKFKIEGKKIIVTK